MPFKLNCYRCGQEKVEIIVILSGPHKKAICAECKRYIKFLTKWEMQQIENDEDENAKTT